MWLYADPVETLERTATDAEDKSHEAEAVEGIDPSIGANEVLEHARRLSLRALTHANQVGYCQYTDPITRPESLPVAVPSVPSRHPDISSV